MKCIEEIATGKMDRVKDHIADQKVKSGKYKYIPKHIYRESFIKERKK